MMERRRWVGAEPWSDGQLGCGGPGVARSAARPLGEADRDPQTAEILGAAVEVHCTLAREFLEAVYQRALCLELRQRGVPYVSEAPVPVRYKGEDLGCQYRADVICWPEDEPVLLELKALTRLTDVERAQVLHYVRASRIRRALLLNFGAERLEIQRFVNG
jgi:GxxExxY protein